MISKHVNIREAVYSTTATRLGIDNEPTKQHLENMITVADEIFEPLRGWVGGPIDIDDTYKKATNAEMFNFIKQNLDFDQMIWEFGDDDNPNWVHVSYVSPTENRKRCLKAYKENKITKYKII